MFAFVCVSAVVFCVRRPMLARACNNRAQTDVYEYVPVVRFSSSKRECVIVLCVTGQV